LRFKSVSPEPVLQDGTLQEGPEVLRDMAIMIRHSDNGAATRMIDRLGLQKICHILEEPCYKLYDPEWGGGLWVGKCYAKQGDR